MRKYKKKFRTNKKNTLFKIKSVLLSISLLIIISGFVYLLFFSQVFKIKKIEVFGAEKIPQEEIKSLISNKISNNIFLADLQDAKDYIAEFYPQIRAVNIKRKMPNTIVAEIEERKPVAVLNNFFIIDKGGVAFDTGPNKYLPQIIDEGIKDVELGEKAVERIDDILKITKKIKTKQITIVSNKRLDAESADGFDIYFSLEKDVNWQTEQLQTLLQEKIPPEERKNIEYIDLRYDKIFVKKAS